MRSHSAAAGERFTGRVPLPTVSKHSPRSTAAPSPRWPGPAARHCGSGRSAAAAPAPPAPGAERVALGAGSAAPASDIVRGQPPARPVQYRRAPAGSPAALGLPSGLVPAWLRARSAGLKAAPHWGAFLWQRHGCRCPEGRSDDPVPIGVHLEGGFELPGPG